MAHNLLLQSRNWLKSVFGKLTKGCWRLCDCAYN